MEVSTIGLDLAKQVFQVHGVDAKGTEVLRRRLRGSEVVNFFGALPGCLVGIEQRRIIGRVGYRHLGTR